MMIMINAMIMMAMMIMFTMMMVMMMMALVMKDDINSGSSKRFIGCKINSDTRLVDDTLILFHSNI